MRPVRFALAALALSVSILALPALSAGDDGADPQALATLSDVPGVLDTSAATPTSSDSDSALTAQVGGVAVDVPKDPSAGVTLDPGVGAPVNVGVPNADQAGDGVPVAAGVIVYPDAGPSAAVAVQVVAASSDAPAADPPVETTTTDVTTTDTQPADGTDAADATATATDPTDTADTTTDAAPAPAADPAPPVAKSLGGVRLMTMLEDAEAPTDYAFALSLPAGGTIVSDGADGYDIADAAGVNTLHIAAPWARDANDTALPVSYSLDGTTLTMHIDTSSATFPVVADPLLTAAVAGGSAPAASSIAAAPAARPSPTPAPAPVKPAEKPELNCAGGSSNGIATTSCSLSVPLWAGGGGVDYESGSILVRCKNCGDDQLSRLTRFYGSMLNWKVDGRCGSNCTVGRSSASTSYEVTKTTVMVAQQSTCTSLVGKILVRKACTVLVAETRTVLKTVTHYTCALNVVGGFLVKVAADTYAISAAFRLSCPDGGGSASGSIESNDFRNAVLGL